MRSFSIIYIFLFLIMLLAYQCSSAQDFLVTTKGDTVAGKLKPLVFGPDLKVQVAGADKKKTNYGLTQTKLYVLNGDTYRPLKGPNGYAFMKVIKDGYLSLYAFPLENQNSYNGLYLQKRDGSGIEVPNLTFKKVMKEFLDDCEDVVKKIDDGTLGKRELTAIVDAYNDCVDQRTINHETVIAEQAQRSQVINVWQALEEKVKSQEFDRKSDALEMIGEIRTKVSRSERIPNFLVEGLKDALSGANAQPELDKALNEIR